MVKRSRENSISSASDASCPAAETPTRNPLSLKPADEKAHTLKYTELDGRGLQAPEVMRCFLPPHREPIAFSSYEEYDVHYAKAHTNRCLDCRKNFPTEHFVGLHIAENHDPLNEARKARGEKTYGCFVEDCERKCSTPEKRRMHVIDKHMFPRNYDFHIVNDGIDKRSSMLRSRPGHRRQSLSTAGTMNSEQRRRRRSSLLQTPAVRDVGSGQQHKEQGEASFKASATPPDASEGNLPTNAGPLDLEDDCDEEPSRKADELTKLANSMSALKLIPPSVRFGKGRGRKGLSSS